MSQQPPTGPPPSGPPPQQPPPPPPAPTGTLVVHLQGSVLSSSMITPTVRLNGYPVPASYGPNSYPLAAGRWHVDVSAQWMRTYGQAALDAEVAPAHMTEVYYAAPIHQFTTGNIGFDKQKRKGLLPMVVVVGLLAALVVLLVVASLL